MSQIQTRRGVANYTCYDWGEMIYGEKEALQSFGIGIGLTFPGETNGPKRQLIVRDPRGFQVMITKNYCRSQPFQAKIRYPHLPERPKHAESRPFPGVRKREVYGCNEFSGSAEHLIAAGFVTAEHLPGAPGMRKTRVTILAVGSVLDGNYASNIPGGRTAGVKHIERASSRSATFTVRIHVEKSEEERRNSRREIAESAWVHEARKLPRPRKLSPCYCDTVSQIGEAALAANHDTRFQAMLGKLVGLPAGEAT